MKNLFIGLSFAGIIFSACQSTTQTFTNLDELTDITDHTEEPICALSLDGIFENFNQEQIVSWREEMNNPEHVQESYPLDFVSQIRIQLRRAALNRRLQAAGDIQSVAGKLYTELDDNIPNPGSLADHHDKMHYWSDRVGEQTNFDSDSDFYQIRFCILNEARAKVFSNSRKFILDGIANETISLGPEVLENINHEIYHAETFKTHALALLFADEGSAILSPIERAKLRSSITILPDDPKTVDAFFSVLDEEIEATKSRIINDNYETVADKLSDMSLIDQNARRFFSSRKFSDHFEGEAIAKTAKSELIKRLFEIDAFNTNTIKSMLIDREWFRDDHDGDGAAHTAWLIVQHADQDPEFQSEALSMIEAQLGAPGVSKSNYAYLYDRVMAKFAREDTNSQKKQRYGTQGRCTGKGTWEPLPLEDPENIDALRAEMGLGPLEEYKARFKNSCFEDQR